MKRDNRLWLVLDWIGLQLVYIGTGCAECGQMLRVYAGKRWLIRPAIPIPPADIHVEYRKQAARGEFWH